MEFEEEERNCLAINLIKPTTLSDKQKLEFCQYAHDHKEVLEGYVDRIKVNFNETK